MFLEVCNISKIKKAKITLRGITVLAGNNNTGKSTFGKTLFCMFNSFFNAKNAIQKERYNDIKSIIDRFIRSQHFDRRGPRVVENIIDELSKKDINIEHVLRPFFGSALELQDENKFLTLCDRIAQSKNVSDNEIQKKIISHWFNGEFNSLITHIDQPDDCGEVVLTIHNREIKVKVDVSECVDFSDAVGIQHCAVLIDTPFLFDGLIQHSFYTNNYRCHHWNYLWKKLYSSACIENIVEEVVIKRKIDSAMQLLQSVVRGSFRDTEQGLGFQETGLSKPLHISKVSTGMKMFLIVKRLLESGGIKDQDVVIFDEPEIHLHPEWQLVFAELLVLLQQNFKLTILLTTHSPYFLNAIENV